jgi:hypothetical protein
VLRSDCTLIVLVRGPGALGSQPPAARPWHDALRMPPSPVVPSLRPSLLLPRSLLPVAVVSVTGRRCLGRQTTRCRTAPRPVLLPFFCEDAAGQFTFVRSCWTGAAHSHCLRCDATALLDVHRSPSTIQPAHGGPCRSIVACRTTVSFVAACCSVLRNDPSRAPRCSRPSLRLTTRLRLARLRSHPVFFTAHVASLGVSSLSCSLLSQRTVAALLKPFA